MTHTRLTILGAALLAATVSAQSSITSPAGFANREGSANHDYILFRQNSMRWQQIDHTHRNKSYLFLGVAWRRDHTPVTDATWGPRTIGDFTLVMAPVAFGHVLSGTNLDGNYTAPPTVVVNPVALSLPNWTQQTASTPEPWIPNIPFDTPWFSSGATDDFVWEVRYSSGMNSATATDYGNDYQTGSATATDGTTTAGTALGTGCIATGQVAAMALTGTFGTYVDRFTLALTVANGPANSPTVAWLDFADPNLPLPGLCTNLRSLGTLQIGMPTTSGTGASSLSLNLGKSPTFIGTELFFQALSLDGGQPGLPVAASNGRQFNVPIDNYNCSRVYNYTIAPGGNLITSTVWNGGIVTRFEAVPL